MIFCSFCKCVLSGYIEELRRHIIIVHGIVLGTKSTPCSANFVCGQNGCAKTLSNFKSFRKHIQNYHPANFQYLASTVSNPPGSVSSSLIDQSNVFNLTDQTEPSDLDPVPDFSANTIEFIIKKSICELKTDTKLTSATIARFVDTCQEITSNVLEFLKKNVEQFLGENNINMSSDKSQNLINSFTDVPLCFEKIKSSSQQKKFMKTFLNYNEPIHVKAGSRLENVTVNDESITKEVDETFSYVSVINTLSAIVQHPDIRKMIETESRNGNGLISSYKDGSQFPKHPFFQKFPTALRLTIYYDDVEITNPLGTKCRIHEIGAFYFSIQNCNNWFNSNMKNIFIFNIAHTLDIKKYGFDVILKPFIEELKLLESDSGIDVTLANGEQYKLRASLVNFIGDSKAIHEIFEFKSSSCDKFCCVCMVSRYNLHVDISGTLYEKRNPTMHSLQLQQLENNEIRSKDVGFFKDSVLNQSKYFHCTNNYSFDPMHDLLEGVVPMSIKHVLKYLVVEKKYFDVGFLNSQIHSFEYGSIEKKNKPSANFTLAMLTSSDHSIKQYAIQTWVLLRVLPFLVHNKFDFDESEHMRILYLLEKVMEIVFSVEITQHMLVQLEDYVFNHDILFTRLFPAIRRINKCHHLTHYAECIELNGPIIHCLRYEAKHQAIKKQFQSSGNFKNVTKSIADRQIFKQNLYLFNSIKVTNSVTTNSSKFILASRCLSNEFLSEIEIVQRCMNITIDFIQYRINQIVQLPDPGSLHPNFFKILEIIKLQEKVYFFCAIVEIIEYNEKLNSFEVKENPENCFFEFSSIIDRNPMSIWKIDEHKKFLKLKTYVF